MTNPMNPYDTQRSHNKKQEFLLFCIIVAGRNSDWAASCVSRLLARKPEEVGAIDWLTSLGTELRNTLVANRVGQYSRIELAIEQAQALNLHECTVDDLMDVHGIGPKTARFFLLNTREGIRHAVLDVHMLSWLRDLGLPDVPRQTPNNAKAYEYWEGVALSMLDHYYGHLSPAKADLLVWARQSGRLGGIEP